MPPEEQPNQHHDEPAAAPAVLPNHAGGAAAAAAGLMDEHQQQQSSSSSSPSSSARGVPQQQEQHPVDIDDDDDSYHDLDAVLALVAASEGSAQPDAASAGDTGSIHRGAAAAAAAPPLDAGGPGSSSMMAGVVHHPLDSAVVVDAAVAAAAPSSPSSSRLRRRAPSEEEEECKEEIVDSSNVDEQDSNSDHRIPHRYACTTTPVEEASVLLESVACSASLQHSQQDDDARLAAAAAEEEELLLALKRSAYEGGGGGGVRSNNYGYHTTCTAYDQQQQQQEATVLEITDERYDAGSYAYLNSNNNNNASANAAATTTAHAEWIGQDYSNSNNSNSDNNQATTNHGNSNTRNQTAAAAAVAVSEERDDEVYYDETAAAAATTTTQAAEATVIDSAPLEKNQSGCFTEEAQVLLEEEQQQQDDEEEEDSKPAARRDGGGLRNDEEEAEVLGIQERGDIHPVEFASVDASEDAELVRTDYSYTVALPSSTSASSTAESAAVTAATATTSTNANSGEEDAVSAAASQPAATTAPQAMAVVAPSSMARQGNDDDDDDDTTNLTTASAVHEDNSPFLNTEQQQETAPVEHAQVLESESSDTSLQEDDKADASADDSPNRDEIVGTPPHHHHPSPSQIRRSLSAIAEQEGEVVSIQEDRDLHPVIRAETRQYDSEAEFLGTDDSVNITASAVAAPTPQATAVTATPRSFADAGYAGSANHPTAASSPGDDDEAQVVSIQDVQDLHPAADDRQHLSSSGVDAELVGEVPAAATLVSNDDHQGRIFTEPSGVADSTFSSPLGHPQATTATWVDHSAAAIASQPVVQTASVFVDPHQPHAPPEARRRESDDDLRAALAAIDAMEQGEHQRDLLATDPSPDKAGPNVQDAGGAFERGQSDGVDEYSLDWLRDSATSTTPHQQRIGSGTNETSNGSSATGSTRGTIHSVSRSTAAGIQQLSNNIVRSTSTVLEALFGDASSPFAKRSARGEDLANAIFSRTLLPWSVIHNRNTGMWIATLQTNQKALDKNNVVAASKSLRAFSMPTERQAICLAKAWTPPRMLPFENHKSCHLCGIKFAMFRRACHCRNCGVCVCKDCVVAWPSKMVPETFLTKKSNFVNACRSCDWLSTSFRVALLEGDLDKAVAIHGTGNVNLHTPFCNVKGELFYPVHCAVLGGNIDCLKFLVDSNCCPIKSVRVSGSGNSSKFTPIVTSKGRSLLGIAMEKENIEMIRYLVLQKGAVLSGEMDITSDMLARNLERVLRILPEDAITRGVPDPLSPSENNHSASRPDSSPAPMGGDFDGVVPMSPNQHGFNADDNARSLSEEARDFGAVKASRQEHYENESEEQVNDECIICFDRQINCVATPCGHQCCCTQCSDNLNSRCPVCSSECSFMRVYKP